VGGAAGAGIIDVSAKNESWCMRFAAESGFPLGALRPLAVQRSITDGRGRPPIFADQCGSRSECSRD
jgi:hypothetical protein